MSATKTRDHIQDQLTDFACNLDYETLSPEVKHAAKTRIVYSLGALIAGLDGEPSKAARRLAQRMLVPDGATVIGTGIKTSPEIAALANGTAARYIEMNDIYHWPGSYEGHASDVVPAVLTAAEYGHADGPTLVTAVVLAYEVFLRLSDVVRNQNFDNTNFCSIAVAAAAGRLWRLSPEQMTHCLAMAAVSGNMLRQVRKGHLSMWKAAAAGNAGRNGLYAALLARDGMDGPQLPFEGESGWCDHVAGTRFTLERMGSQSDPCKILDTRLKRRAACGTTISSILAAEKVAGQLSPGEIESVTVAVYRKAKVDVGTGEHKWHPQTRESADHSIPYVVAATLMDGTVTPQSFDAAHLQDAALRALMRKICVVEDEQYTLAYERVPVEHRSRVTIVMRDGRRHTGESGGDADDLSEKIEDHEVVAIFRNLTQNVWTNNHATEILDLLWSVEKLSDVATIAPLLVCETSHKR